MRNFDLSPLFRNTVGFDGIFSTLENLASEGLRGFPPYDIEKLEENRYRITLAVAGFGPDDISVETQEGSLVIRGGERKKEGEGIYLHRGIANRSFVRRFQLAEYVDVTAARLENGLLAIDLVREIPEAKRPRRIEIQGPLPAAA
jgi:Molecular chaperone (small heat shock protein)